MESQILQMQEGRERCCSNTLELMMRKRQRAQAEGLAGDGRTGSSSAGTARKVMSVGADGSRWVEVGWEPVDFLLRWLQFSQ